MGALPEDLSRRERSPRFAREAVSANQIGLGYWIERTGRSTRAKNARRDRRDLEISVVGPKVAASIAVMSLDLRPNCECCDRDLPPDSREAYICTFECTFCLDCASTKLGFICANCGGELVRRPIRPAAELLKNPGSTTRLVRSEPCRPLG